MKKVRSKNNVFLVADAKSLEEIELKDINSTHNVFMVLDVNNIDNLRKLATKILKISKKLHRKKNKILCNKKNVYFRN